MRHKGAVQFRILYQDKHLVAVDKPSGIHVHPPEDRIFTISESKNGLAILRDQLGQYLFPIHRLDVATSGVLLYALNQEMAREMAERFRLRQILKTYYAVVRGWIPQAGRIERPLGSEADPKRKLPAGTDYLRIALLELPRAVGRYPTARYSLVRCHPTTGRYHQIRRHWAGLSHPIVGDTVRGDGVHNRFFRNELKIPSLLLKAQSIGFTHPMTGASVIISSKWSGKWHRVFDLFGVCPYGGERIG